MALLVDNEAATNGALKHFCRICKKGFGCGRALGGHMRAHGIGGDDSSGNHIDDDDDDTTNNDDWPDDSDKAAPSSKRMYALRANPNNRLRSSRACENCGKEFLSWKSFLEHGKCVSDDADSLVSSSPPDSGGGGGRGGGNWSKRKRSFRAKVGNLNPVGQICPSSEDEDLANCLMMLSNAAVDPAAEPEESCASASRDELIDQHPRKNNNNNNNNNNNATVALNHFNISPISFRVPDNNNSNNNYNNNNNKILGKGVHNNINIHNNNNNNKGLFECKACKKVFNSHQALGGHRASHKKVKGCFAARLDAHYETLSAAAEDDASADDPQSFPPATPTTNHNSNNLNNSSLIAAAEHVGPAKRKSKAHECSICHRIFSSGQALGGHKRCHWITSNSAAAVSAAAGPGAEATVALAKFQQFQESIEQINLAAAAAAAAAAVAAQQHNNNINIKAVAAVVPTVANSGLDLKLDLNLPANNNENVSTEIFLQPWIGSPMGTKHDQRDDHDRDNHIPSDVDEHVADEADHQCNAKKSSAVNSVVLSAVMEDEADSKVKLARLSELKDMNVSEGSSWLQVGIGSTTDVGSTVA